MPTTSTSDSDGVSTSKDPVAAGSVYGTFSTHSTEGCHEQNSVSLSADVPETGSSPGRTNILIYCSHFLSAWGDRMWSFGVGLFLVRIAGNNLQLPATYGLTSGLAIFCLGALVGEWVDSTPRLKAAQTSLVVQNLVVAVCAGGVYAYLRWEEAIKAEPGGWAVPLCHGAVILLAVVSDLASVARVIAVERDWIVKICGSDTDLLAKMTATLRRIDQTTLILAPIATGQIMTYVGLENGALFIGGWNLVSVVLEYYLMWKVYTTVPALAYKQLHAEEERLIGDDKAPKRGRTRTRFTQNQTTDERETTLSQTSDPSTIRSHHQANNENNAKNNNDDDGAYTEESLVVKTTPQRNEFSKSQKSDLIGTVDTEILLDESDNFETDVNGSGSQNRCCGRVMSRFSALYEGWRQYIRYNVALAGLALSFLFMTVLGFDNITVAYAVTQGVSESILGIMMAVSACFGMLGTFIYPIMRRRVGLIRTGIIALSCMLTCLSLCVVSIWMPGSPFDPTYSKAASDADVSANVTTITTWGTSSQMLNTIRSAPATDPNLPTTQTMITGSFPGSVSTTSVQSTTSLSPVFYLSTQTLPISSDGSNSWTTSLLGNQITDNSSSESVSFLATESISQTSTSPDTLSSLDRTNSRLVSTSSGSVPAQTMDDDVLTTSSETILSDSTKHIPRTTISDSSSNQYLTSAESSATTSAGMVTADGSSALTSVSSEVPSPSSEPSSNGEKDANSYLSVSLLLAGIVTARFGLWMADLSITQQFLEAVREGERGAVNGVQSALNQLLGVLKFLLVVLLPDTETFGILILLSFSFISMAWLLYAIFLRRARGHFFPRIKKLCSGGDIDYARI